MAFLERHQVGGEQEEGRASAVGIVVMVQRQEGVGEFCFVGMKCACEYEVCFVIKKKKTFMFWMF